MTINNAEKNMELRLLKKWFDDIDDIIIKVIVALYLWKCFGTHGNIVTETDATFLLLVTLQTHSLSQFTATAAILHLIYQLL